jgi:two-component sensor histidine kinase
MHCSYVPEFDREGRVVGLVAAISDLTERRRIEESLEERNREVEGLNQRLQRAMTETHHRVKNNLQLIAAMIDLQHIASEAVEQAAEFMRLSDNVRALAVIHDILTQEAKAGNQDETVSARAVMLRLLQALEQATAGRPLIPQIDEARLTGKQTTTLALVTNELISNAVKHGRGAVEIRLTVEGNTAKLVISDEGPGLPDGFQTMQSANTGLDLVESLVGWDLRGQISYGNRPQGGAQVSVSFPLIG